MFRLGGARVQCRRVTLARYFAATSSSHRTPRKWMPSDKWNYNPNVYTERDVSKEELSYPLVTANDLDSYTKPPREVRMLVRDFIEDSLYNPNYGYFPKQANILDTNIGTDNLKIPFESLRDSAEFQELVSSRYDAIYGADATKGPSRQLWHTPTELFRPHYGEAVAKCLVSEYLLKYFPYEDLVIYEIGAGNGSLAIDVLNCLREQYPEVYDRTRYHIIEISHRLSEVQKGKLRANGHSCANVTNKSIFRWNTREPAPCFFLAMEVVDNFPHDVIRYDMRTMRPYQAIVTVDSEGEFDMLYEPISDSLIKSFVSLRSSLGHSPQSVSPLLIKSPLMRRLYSSLPFAPNLSQTEFIPTRMLSMLRTIRSYFPRHRLLLADFSSLPDTIPGVDAPVVQTRVQGKTVPTETLLVQPGWFDIFFPTNFDRLRDMYEHILALPSASFSSLSDPLNALDTSDARVNPISPEPKLSSSFFSSHYPSNRRRPLDGVSSASGLPVGERMSSVWTHAEFLETYADVSKTRLRNGENPLLDFYGNVKVLF